MLSFFLAGVIAVTSLLFGAVVSGADDISLKQEYDLYVTNWFDNNPSFKAWYEDRIRAGGYSGIWDNDIPFIASWRDDLLTYNEYRDLKTKYPILNKDFFETYNNYCSKWWERMKKAYQPLFDDRKNKRGKAEWQSYMASPNTIEEYVQLWHSPMSIEDLLEEMIAFPEGALVSEGELIDYGDVSKMQYLSKNDGMLHLGCNPYVELRVKQVLNKTVNVTQYKDTTKYQKVDVPQRGDLFITDGHYVFVEDVGKMSNGDYIVYSSDGNCAFRPDGFVCRDIMSKKLKDLAAYHGAYYRIIENKIGDLSFSDISDMTYTGKAIKPSVNVKDGTKTLVKGTDYTISYKNNKNIGTATVTITGKGSYTGTKSLTFKIIPAKTTLTAKKSNGKYALSWKKVTGIDKYQIQYSTDSGKTYKTAGTVSSGKTSATLKLDTSKSYTFRIRSYKTVDGKKYYSSWSKTVTVK